VFDAPASLAERVSFGRAARVQHTEQLLHGVGHGSSPLRAIAESSAGVWRQRLVIQHARTVVALTTSFTPIAAKPRDSRLEIFSRTLDRLGFISFVGHCWALS
jgi:hypothetical protein